MADPKRIEACRGLVKFLDSAVKNVALYPGEHPSLMGLAGRIRDIIGRLLASGDDAVRIRVGEEGILAVQDYVFTEPTPASGNLLQCLNRLGVRQLGILDGIDERELLELASLLRSRDLGPGGFERAVDDPAFGHVFTTGGTGEDAPSPADVPGLYKSAVAAAGTVLEVVREGGIPRLDEVRKVAEMSVSVPFEKVGRLLMLGTLDAVAEAGPARHAVNVAILSLVSARRAGMEEGKARWAALAGLVHDMGFARMSWDPTGYPGPLSPRQWALVRTHPAHSAEIVHAMGGDEEAAAAVRGHHMHRGPGGYPGADQGGGPSDLARLLSIVETYDAMISARPYARPRTPVEALEELRAGRGTRFDGRLVDTFLSMMGPYPPGSLVRLADGAVGVVVGLPAEQGGPPAVMLAGKEGPPEGGPGAAIAGPAQAPFHAAGIERLVAG